MSASSLSITMPATARAPQGRVLCVDDEPNILRALSWLLKKEFHVVTAQSASEGLELIRCGDFDVVISDQRMPEMCGVDFLNEVKTLAPRAMRILLTGYSDLQAVLRSVNESEIFRFVTKPWDVEELPAIVAQAVAIAKGQAVVAPAPLVPNAAASRAARILVLDDDEAIHSAVEMSAGDLAEVIHVTSPLDAFTALKEEDIGVILAERKLGSMDLTHLLCLLKRQHPQIVSVVLTDTADTELVRRLINQGQIFRFIPKPAKAADLRTALKAALAKRQELVDNPALASRYLVAGPGGNTETASSEARCAEAPTAPAGGDRASDRSLTESVGKFMRQLFGG